MDISKYKHSSISAHQVFQYSKYTAFQITLETKQSKGTLLFKTH